MRTHAYTCSFKVILIFGAGAFDAAATPLLPAQKPAGAMLSFPRPKGVKFKRRLKLRMRIMRWILILLKLIFKLRRELNEGEFILEDEELKNVYHDNGALMWRGRRLLQTGTAEVNKVEQASFDAATQVSCLTVPALFLLAVALFLLAVITECAYGDER
jgi:hypothetical protein